MDDLQELESWLTLQHLQVFPPSQAFQLLAFFGSPQVLLQADDVALDVLSKEQASIIKAIRDNRHHEIHQQVKRHIEWLEQAQVRVVTYFSQHYPQALKETHRPPLLLYVKGNIDVLHKTQVAVVGARKASSFAQDIAYQWSAELARQGVVITSGLALGIDGAAHKGALSVSAETIAVLAHGLDQIYPARHKQLAEEICESGALVSEFPLGSAPKKDHFPRRNRIISGLSMGVLVVEAAVKSGSLITARYALEQNRDVFAVPGSINNVMAKGCHYLIKEGAYLVEGPEDILHAMAWQSSKQEELFPAVNKQALSDKAKKVLECIPFDAVHLDSLMQSSKFSIADLTIELLLLEAEGYIEALMGNYRRVK
jgi:DNA processing protein